MLRRLRILADVTASFQTLAKRHLIANKLHFARGVQCAQTARAHRGFFARLQQAQTRIMEKRLLDSRQLTALVVLTIFWGVNWPVLKLGVTSMPPVWFRFLGVAGGTVLLGAYAAARAEPMIVPHAYWGKLAIVAVLNMILWYLLGAFALAMLPAGRAAILGYTMPVWAALIGALFYGERLDRLNMLGVLCALSGTLLLVAREWSSLTGHPLGTLLMLVAAMIWGVGTHVVRRAQLPISTLCMTFWMMVMSCVVLGVFTALFESSEWSVPQGVQWLPIAYNAVFVLGLCNVLWFWLARELPPVASGLSGMMIPVLGVFSSLVMLGERPHWQDYLALLLILASLSTVLFGRKSY
jgi:drug/metabolite transporter (DMT)-like permease